MSLNLGRARVRVAVAAGFVGLVALTAVAWASTLTTVSRSGNAVTVQGTQQDLVELGHLDGGTYRLTLTDIGCHMSASLETWTPPRVAYPEPRVFIGAMTPWRRGPGLDQARSSAPVAGAVPSGRYNLSVGYAACACLGVGDNYEHSQPCRWRVVLVRAA